MSIRKRFILWSGAAVILAWLLVVVGWAQVTLACMAFGSAIMATVFTVALWMLAPWEKSPMGRALMALSASLAGALDFTLINALLHRHYHGEYIVAILLYLAIGVATGNLFRLLLNRQNGTPTLLEMEGSGHERHDSERPDPR